MLLKSRRTGVIRKQNILKGAFMQNQPAMPAEEARTSCGAILSDEDVRLAAAELRRAHPKLAAVADASTFTANKAALYRSVDMLSVSDGLKEAWRQAALTDPALRLPVFFVRCVDIGYATNPISLRRGFREADNTDEDLFYLFRLLGRYQADAIRMVCDAELDTMAEDERRALSERAIEVFLDIYPFLREEQKRIAPRIENVRSLAEAAARNAEAALANPATSEAEHAALEEDIAACTFTVRLIEASL